MDSSADMVATARARLPHLAFQQASLETWDEPGAWDVMLSNAVLQWVPDHATLLPRLVGHLAPGGSLAVQLPDNLDEPAYVAMRQVAADGPWASTLAQSTGFRAEQASAGQYYTMLRPHCARVDVWRTTYHHALAGGADAVIEWFRGSGLRPFLAPLDTAAQAAFLARYREEIVRVYPAEADGTVLLPFPRLFMVATR